MNTLKELVTEVAKLEAGKKEVEVGNIREVLNRLATLMANDITAGDVFNKYVKSKIKKITKYK